jgi:hypothetical protein
VGRPTNLLDENLQSLASKIFRFQQTSEVTTGVVRQQHAVVETVTGLHIEGALQIGVH